MVSAFLYCLKMCAFFYKALILRKAIKIKALGIFAILLLKDRQIFDLIRPRGCVECLPSFE